MVDEEQLISPDVESIARSVNASFKDRGILLTGGAGFLGSWLCDVLVSSGAKVLCLDNLVTQGTNAGISHLLKNRNFRFIKADITKWKPVGDYDYIIHAASIPSPEQYMEKPVSTMLASSAGLHSLLNFAVKRDCVLLYTSTSEIYGDATVVPTPESYVGATSTTGPRASYYESKRYGETACLAYRKQYGIDVRIARIFNSYGPRLDESSSYSRVISRFVVQSLRNKPLTVHGNGEQTRSFCYVTDTISGLLRFIRASSLGGTVLNIGNTDEISIASLARMIIRLVGSGSSIKFEAARPDDPSRPCPDIARAKKLLGWSPKVTLSDGLKRTLEWFRQMDQRSTEVK